MSRTPTSRFTHLVAFCALAFSAAPATAQTPYYWNAGTGGIGNWDLATTNWGLTPGGPAASLWLNDGTALANFGDTGGTVTVSSPIQAYGLSFSTSGYTIAGSTGNSITLMGSGGGIDTGSFNASIGAVLAGGVGLTKNGSGTLSISGTNTYTGVTTVNAGTLLFTSTAGLGATGAGNDTIVKSGASLTLGNNAFNPSEAVTINGTGTTNEGALRKIGTTNSNLSGAITLGSSSRINSDTTGLFTLSGAIGADANNLTIGGTGNVSITSVITSSGALNKDGVGTLTLSGGNSTTLTGAVNITGGVLSYASNLSMGTAAGSGPVTIDGGTLRHTNPGSGGTFLSANRNIVIGSNGGAIEYTTAASTNSTIYSGTILGTGTLTKIGNGEFRYQGAGTGSTTFTKLVVNEGLYRVGAGSTEAGFGAVPGFLLADAITLNGGAIGTSFNATLNVNRGITLGIAGGTINISSGTFTIPGVITGSGGLTVFRDTGSQVLILSGANDYSGATTVADGNLRAGAINTFPSGTAVSIANLATASFQLNSFNQTIGSLSGGGAAGGNVTLGSATLTTGDATMTSYAGIISGTGGLTKIGSGTQTLTGVNTYTGATTINAGTLALGTGGSLAAGSAVTVNNTATLRGTGTVNGAVTVNIGGTLGGGDGTSVGTLSIGGNVIANATTTGAARLAVTATTTNASQIAITGSVNFASSTGSQPYVIDLNIPTLVNGTPYSYTILTANGGIFSQGNGPLPQNTPFTLNSDYILTSQQFPNFTDVSLIVGPSNSLVLTFTPVPEPATVLGLAAGAMGLGGMIRRRFRRAQVV